MHIPGKSGHGTRVGWRNISCQHHPAISHLISEKHTKVAVSFYIGIMSIYQPIQAPLKGRGMVQSCRELLWYCEYMPPSRISAQRGMRDKLTKPMSNPRYPSNSGRFHDRSCIPRLEYKLLSVVMVVTMDFQFSCIPQVFKLPAAGACVKKQVLVGAVPPETVQPPASVLLNSLGRWGCPKHNHKIP